MTSPASDDVRQSTLDTVASKITGTVVERDDTERTRMMHCRQLSSNQLFAPTRTVTALRQTHYEYEHGS